ncbi:hypothetical protein HPB50_024629 [Hyalomma asiaticum]|uniref:Uncharacterized protein n=1 Tax=Hyalomma asiaticum TaxID=266040 RepID=A0ACB7S8F8_HYAAI|nr:hypothetical protein HPB50_024629 [Hyalomma asiaticum]
MRSSIDTSPSGTLNKKQFSLTGKLNCEAKASGRCRAPRWLKQPPGRGAYLVDWSRAAHAASSYQQDSRAQPQALLLLGSGPLVARQMALAGREASENITGSARWSPITGSVQWSGREGRQPQQDAVDVKKDPGAHVTKTRSHGNADDGSDRQQLGRPNFGLSVCVMQESPVGPMYKKFGASMLPKQHNKVSFVVGHTH